MIVTRIGNKLYFDEEEEQLHLASSKIGKAILDDLLLDPEYHQEYEDALEHGMFLKGVIATVRADRYYNAELVFSESLSDGEIPIMIW